MTDGNHGRAVARAARNHMCKSVIFVPEIMSEARKDNIIKEGAEVIVDKRYDDAIDTVFQKSKENGWHLVMDTSISGYLPEVPSDIVAGYGGVIFGEVRRQMKKQFKAEKITHLV